MKTMSFTDIGRMYHRESVKIYKDRAEIQEALLHLYLRLNGYFVSGFIVHSSEYGKNKTQIDALAIRHSFNLEKSPHIDYGYAVTSHSSQGQTADRVLIHTDTEQDGEKLVNRRLAYVAVSRGRYDAQVYTDDALALRDALSRDVSKSVAR